MLTKQKIEQYKKELGNKKGQLLKELKELETPKNFGGDVDGFDEESDEAEEFSTQMATSQIIREQINEVDSALNDIEEGKYGICKKCGNEISERVLNVVPESRLCENCKKKTK